MSKESEFNDKDIIEVNRETVEYLIQRAAESPRKRYRLCLHHSPDFIVNEMVIVGNHDTYVHPHRHPKGKDESYAIIQGDMVVFIFDNNGNVIRHVKMGEYGSGKTVLYRLSSDLWHLPVPLTEWVVYHEIFTGPFRKELDVEYAPWAPPETDHAAVAEYMKMLLISS